MKEEPETKRPKRSYKPPAVEDTAEFETLALMCGHEPGNALCENYNPPVRS